MQQASSTLITGSNSLGPAKKFSLRPAIPYFQAFFFLKKGIRILCAGELLFGVVIITRYVFLSLFASSSSSSSSSFLLFSRYC